MRKGCFTRTTDNIFSTGKWQLALVYLENIFIIQRFRGVSKPYLDRSLFTFEMEPDARREEVFLSPGWHWLLETSHASWRSCNFDHTDWRVILAIAFFRTNWLQIYFLSLQIILSACTKRCTQWHTQNSCWKRFRHFTLDSWKILKSWHFERDMINFCHH